MATRTSTMGRGNREAIAKRVSEVDQMFSKQPRRIVDVAQELNVSIDAIRADIKDLKILGSNVREIDKGLWFSSHPALSKTDNSGEG